MLIVKNSPPNGTIASSWRVRAARGGALNTRWFTLVFCFCVAATSFPFSASAQFGGACPAWVVPDMPRTENTYRSWSTARNEPRGVGPRLDTMMYYWTRGALFHLPYGYFNQWGHLDDGEDTEFPDLDTYMSNVATHSARNGYDSSTGQYNADLVEDSAFLRLVGPRMSFWMPSLRLVERNMTISYDFRPCEPGREPPSEEEYVVMFSIEWPGSPNIEQSRYPARFENIRRRPTSNPNYVRRFDDDFSVMLICTPGRGCTGEVWDKVRDLIIFIMFPEFLRQANPDDFWKDPVNGAIQLIESWRVDNEEIIDGN